MRASLVEQRVQPTGPIGAHPSDIPTQIMQKCSASGVSSRYDSAPMHWLLAYTKPRQEALVEEHQQRRSRTWAEEPLFFPM